MKIAFIGGGNMAAAIVHGLRNNEIYTKEDILVCDKSKSALEKFDGICKTSENNEDALSCDVILLAVKPFVLPYVLQEFSGVKTATLAQKLFISIAAGVSVADIKSVLGSKMRVVRVMPNTPAMVLEGMTVIAESDGVATEEDVRLTSEIFSACGKVAQLPENVLDTVTGVSGSGPAYVFMMIEALADAGVRGGLSRADSVVFAAQTVMGAAKMVLESGKHPGELKDMVCSPKGTTIEAVAHLEKCGFRSAVMEAVDVCIKRAQEINK